MYNKAAKIIIFRGAAIAQWIHLHIPSCHQGFKSQASTYTIYAFINKFEQYLYYEKE